jgi:hypothetical protein
LWLEAIAVANPLHAVVPYATHGIARSSAVASATGVHHVVPASNDWATTSDSIDT